MAVAFRTGSVSALAANATTVTLVVTNSASIVAGDIIICVVLNKDNQTVTFPANWTKFVESNNTTAQRITIAWKLAESGDIGTSFNITKPTDNNTLFCAVTLSFSGCNGSAPIDATTPSIQPTATASDTVSYATFDPTETAAYVVAAGVYNNDLTTAGAISGTNPTFTNHVDLETATGTDGSIFVYSGSSDGAATGARSHSTTSTTDDINIGVLFGLVEAPSFVSGGTLNMLFTT